MKYVIFIPDGSSDYPIDELDGMTPLMAADTPNIDKMAKAGFGGYTSSTRFCHFINIWSISCHKWSHAVQFVDWIVT